MRKARPEAVLKTLPPGIQAELWQLLQSTSYEDAVPLVREKWGVKTGTTALSRFFSWYPHSRILERAATVTDDVMAKLKAAGIDLDDDTASKAGQAFFETLALQERDAELFLDLRKLRLKEKEEVLQRDRFLQTIKSDIEKGLDALHAEIRGNAEALALFDKLKAAVLRSVEGKAA